MPLLKEKQLLPPWGKVGKGVHIIPGGKYGRGYI